MRPIVLAAVLAATSPPPPLASDFAPRAGERPSDAAPPAPPELEGLPVVEVPSTRPGRRLALLLTGDGGWVAIDKGISRALADAGVAVVGLDSPRYFWKRRTPDETAADVARILRHYGAAWERSELMLIGYSRGADIVPFVAARLPADLRGALVLVALLGPSSFAEFEFHLVDLFSSVRRRSALPTEPEVRRSAGELHFLCVRGRDEPDSLCPHLEDLPWVSQVLLPGAHHFDQDYAGLARIVNAAAGGERRTP